MAGVMNKIWNFIGVEQEEDDEEELENEEYEQDYDIEDDEEEERRLFGRNKSKIVNMPQGNSVKMVISQPTTFDQSEEICQYLKERKACIVNLEYVNKDVARRVVDFISGGVYALNGHIQKISNSIFLIAPANYDIANEMGRDEVKSKLSVSWLK
ncbi:MAG: cell division protein SepF [Clostridia bacterium]|jgi:cell division inhibitor SepF|nr:cell division protein SepF [Clostridia bacterium]